VPVEFPKYQPPKITATSLAEKIRQRAAQKLQAKQTTVKRPSYDICGVEFFDDVGDADDDLIVVAQKPASSNPVAA